MGKSTVTWIGPKNSFGLLEGPYTPVDTGLTLQGIKPAHGESLRCVESPFYDTHRGQVHYFTAFAANGHVVVITGSQSNNPLSNTATDCQALALDPKTLRWQSIQVPTSQATTAVNRRYGAVNVVGSNGITGGQDCADVGLYVNPGSGWDHEILMMTFGTYAGWDLNKYGEFPIFTFLVPTVVTGGDPALRTDPNGPLGAWSAGSPQVNITAQAIALSSPSKAAGLYTQRAGLNGTWTDAHAPSEFAQFPQSRHVVFGHYFQWDGGTSGGFSVIDPALSDPGTQTYLKATYKVGNCTGPGLTGYNGSPYLWCAPREIECDPSSSLNDERFTVIYDTYPYAGIGGSGSAPHLMQEFSYNASAGTITPKSGFVNVSQDALAPQPTPGSNRIYPGQAVSYKVGGSDGANQSLFQNHPPSDAKLFTLWVPQGATVTMTGTAVITGSGSAGTILEMDWGDAANPDGNHKSLGFWNFHDGTYGISGSFGNSDYSQDKLLCGWITGGGHADVQFTVTVTGADPGYGSEVGTMRFANDGTLFITTNSMHSLQPNNPMAVFTKNAGERGYVTQIPASSGWESRYNQLKATPDFYVPTTGRNSQVAYSHDVDSSRRNVMTVGLNGYLTVVNWDAGYPLGSNVLASNLQLNNASQPSSMPFTTGFGTATLSWFQMNSKWALKMVSNVANTCNAITPKLGGFTVGRQYRARCSFATTTGATPLKCDVKVDCWDVNGNFIGVTQQIATVSTPSPATVGAGSNPTALTAIVETNFDVLDGTATVQFELFFNATGVGQTVFAQDFEVRQLPFRRTAVIDLGVNKMRSTATANPYLPVNQSTNPMQVRKSCFDQANNKLYTPVGFLGTQILGPQSAAPPTPHQIAQYIVCTDLNNIGQPVSSDLKVQDALLFSANMDTAYHTQSYPFALPTGGSTPMCGFVVNIPISGYPFNFNYSPPFTLGGGIIGCPCAVSWGEGQGLVFVKGSDSQLYYRSQHGATTDAWLSLGGNCTTDPVAVVEPVAVLGTTGYNVHVFVVGVDNQVWQITRNAIGAWGAWTPRGGYVPPAFQGPNKALAAACLGTGKLDIYVTAGANAIYRATYRNGAWTGFGNLGIYGNGYLSAWGEVGSNGGRVWLTSLQANGNTILTVLPDGGIAGSSATNRFGGANGRSSIIGQKTANEPLGTHLMLDVLTVGLAGQLWRDHFQSYVPSHYGPYTNNTWSGYQAVPWTGLGPSVGACTGFHDQKDQNGVPYLTWDAYVNIAGSGVVGKSWLGL